MNNTILNRKGARSLSEIPLEVLKLLNAGKIESANLMEWLAVDHQKLIRASFPSLGISKNITKSILENLKKQAPKSNIQTRQLIANALHQAHTESERDALLERLQSHPSDSIRCYAPYMIAMESRWDIDQKLNHALKLVADKHYSVREVAWMALRPEIDENLDRAIRILSQWTRDPDDNIRRFTTESTRPRGVWCRHIAALKQQPEQALIILEQLKSDPAEYVQKSVGNWLNDASKSAPEFVKTLCEQWRKDSHSKATQAIVKRAMRTLSKKKR